MSIEIQLELVKLTGTIVNYKVTRMEASFVFTDSDRSAMGVTAIAAAVVGFSGPAIATASNAASTEEDADYVEFDLDGRSIKGWVWRSPFKDGDKVEVAAEWREDHYEAAGIARPTDCIIALYPHCSRGRVKHAKNAIKWWFIGTSAFLIFMLFLVWTTVSTERYVSVLATGFHYVAFGCLAFFSLMTFSLTRKWMPFVRLAEKVFVTLEWPNPGNVDLVKFTKAQRGPGDPGELGTFYFRY